jgi:uncharacterized protein YecE (DUF72 family)
MHEICVSVYRLPQDDMRVGFRQITSRFRFCYKMPTTITIVHIFNVSSMNSADHGGRAV